MPQRGCWAIRRWGTLVPSPFMSSRPKRVCPGSRRDDQLNKIGRQNQSDGSEGAGDFFDLKALDDVADLNVLVILEGHAAFVALTDFAHLVLEAL